MTNTYTIFKRQLGSYFNSPIAYFVITLYLTISGVFFFAQVFEAGEASLRSFFELMPLFFIFFGPAVAMPLLSEEKRTGTLEILLTMPVTDWQVVLGKFLAGLTVMTVGILCTLTYPITLSYYGDLDWGAITTGYVGLVLLAGTYVAIGLMTSSWTKDQIIALIIAIGITFFLWLFGKLVPLLPDGVKPIVHYVTLDAHLVSVARGVLDSRDIIYYLSLIGACLFMATQSLDSRRWR